MIPFIKRADTICPVNTICIKNHYFYIILFILILLILYKYIKLPNNQLPNNQLPNNQLPNNQLPNNQLPINQLSTEYNNNQLPINQLPTEYNNNQLPNNQLSTEYNNNDLLSIKKYLENRDKSILYDPLIAPERRISYDQYPNTIKNLINIPTRGYPDNYQLLGLLYRDNDEKILQLYGRPTYPGSNEYEYYATTEQNGFINKIPFRIRGKREIEDQQHIEIPVLKGTFKVKLYDYDTPRYYPTII